MARQKGKLFGEWLDITLSNRGIMGRALADAVGVHDSAVSRWRAGQGVPSIEALERIAEFLSVDPLRLSVTAGQIPPKVAGVEPFEIPEPTARREAVKRQLSRIRGVTEAERRLLLRAYEDATQER